MEIFYAAGTQASGRGTDAGAIAVVTLGSLTAAIAGGGAGTAGATGNDGCRPLVTTQVAVGANLALGSGSRAGQSINLQGQRGALDTIGFTRGVNLSFGAGSAALQRIQNLTSR